MERETETDDIKCDVCCDSPATAVECLEGTDTDLCEDCLDDLPTDDWSGELVREIYENVDGYAISVATYEDETFTCDWSGDRAFNENQTQLSNGDCVNREYYGDEIMYCHDCDYIGHIDDGTYVDNIEAYCCFDCADTHRRSADRWHNRFAKIESNSFSKFPVRNYVGIEFEAEQGEPMRDSMPSALFNKIAEAKDDGSLDNGGTEYVTHPIRGDDISNTVDSMCSLFYEHGYEMSRNVGWHFHYEMEDMSLQRQKNVWKAMQRFDNLIRMSDDFGYFTQMQRSYATGWTDTYVSWASQWAMDKKANYDYHTHRTRATRGSEMGRYAWLNWSPMGLSENKRIEVRLYRPITYRQSFTNFTRWERDAYIEVGNDYKNFIQFWNEFIRKAAYRPRSLGFRDDSHGLIEMKEFAEQFSPTVTSWLMKNYEYTQQQHEGGDNNV